MKRILSAYSLFFALALAGVWATGALEVVHHLATCHGATHGPEASTDAWVGGAEGAGHAEDEAGCSICGALSSKSCCGADPAPASVIAGAAAVLPLDPDPADDRRLETPHNRGPPLLV